MIVSLGLDSHQREDHETSLYRLRGVRHHSIGWEESAVLAQWPKATKGWIIINENIKRHEVKDITLIGQEESAMLGVRGLLFRLVH